MASRAIANTEYFRMFAWASQTPQPVASVLGAEVYH
jgi:hypothetical protein